MATGRDTRNRAVHETNGEGTAHDNTSYSTVGRLYDHLDQWLASESSQDSLWIWDAEEEDYDH
jgi:hypothetical protein